mmetsp:Transcript_35276/g.105379  ORF Transcript_35276/g.105379 Transcript_35276/m.105379 type:complete len:227 (-) Transcript_35276:3211-3891(-)
MFPGPGRRGTSSPLTPPRRRLRRPRLYSPFFSSLTPNNPAMAPMGHPALGDSHLEQSVHAVLIPASASHPGTVTAAAARRQAVIRAGTRLSRSSNRAEGFPNHSYLPRYPMRESRVLTTRYPNAPRGPQATYQKMGATNPSDKFSARDSRVPHANSSEFSDEGSRLHSHDSWERASGICRRSRYFAIWRARVHRSWRDDALLTSRTSISQARNAVAIVNVLAMGGG